MEDVLFIYFSFLIVASTVFNATVKETLFKFPPSATEPWLTSLIFSQYMLSLVYGCLSYAPKNADAGF